MRRAPSERRHLNPRKQQERPKYPPDRISPGLSISHSSWTDVLAGAADLLLDINA